MEKEERKAVYEVTLQHAIKKLTKKISITIDKGEDRLTKARELETKVNSREKDGYWLVTWIQRLPILLWFVVLSMSMHGCSAQQIIKNETIYILDGDPTAPEITENKVHDRLAIVTDSHQLTVTWHGPCSGYVVTVYHFSSQTEVTEYPCLDKAQVVSLINEYIGKQTT